MADTPTRRGRGRGGLGKYLRARGRRGAGRPAEFGKRLLLEDEEQTDDGDKEDGEDGKQDKYAKRQLGTNADRYEEPEVDSHDEQEPEPEVDLSAFLERQRLVDEEDRTLYQENESDDDDDIDHSLSNIPSTSSATPSTRKNRTQTLEWDASMDELKREKEAAEAVWDLKSRFRKNQPRLTASNTKPLARHEPSATTKVEDSRHVYRPPYPDLNLRDSNAKSASKTDMEDFLDVLLS